MYINNNYKSTEMHTNRVTLNHTSSSSNSNTNTFLNRIKRHEQDTCDSCRNLCKDSTIRKKNDNLVLLSNGKLISKGFSSKRSLSSDERYKFLYSISSSSSSNDTESITSSQLQIKQMLDDYKEGHPRSSSYKKFNLIRNRTAFRDEDSPIHRLLPYPCKDNEAYKKNLFRYLRRKTFGNYKTDTCKFNDILQKRETNSKVDFIIQKRKKIVSERKIYSNEHIFFNYKLENGRTINTTPVIFKFYQDNDIGFFSKWQKPLHEAEMDDDVDTDDETLSYSAKRVMQELAEAVTDFHKNRKMCRNYAKYHGNTKCVKVHRTSSY